jgi:hypothetical protein
MFGRTVSRAAAALGFLGLTLAAQDVPRLLDPRPGERPRTPVHFAWTEVPGAQAYNLQVARDENFSPPLALDVTVANRTYYAALPDDEPLWWRVRAIFPNAKQGSWSQARENRVALLPSAGTVRSVSVTPSGVTGGLPIQVVIALDQPAPFGGASVTLTTSHPEIVRISSRRVVFASGRDTVSLDLETAAVDADRRVRITASGRENAREAILTVSASPAPVAPPLASLDVTPATPAAGNDMVGSVTLSALALTPTAVHISSSDSTLVNPPATVTVRRGSRAENFLIKTSRSTANRSVTLTASLAGATRRVEVSLRAAANSDPLAAPALLSPGPDDVQPQIQPINVEWGEVFGAVSYTVQVSASPDFTGSLLIDRTFPATHATIWPVPSGPAWWRVSANDSSGGAGQWSDVRPLRVK